MPTSMIATINSEVPTGRSMKIRDGFMSRPVLLIGLVRLGRTSAAATATAATRAIGAGWGAGRRRRRDRRAGRSGSGAGRGPANLGAFAQTISAVDHHLVADLQAARDRHFLAVGGAEFNDPDLDRVVGLDHIDE